jgi:hypothetical protein
LLAGHLLEVWIALLSTQRSEAATGQQQAAGTRAVSAAAAAVFSELVSSYLRELEEGALVEAHADVEVPTLYALLFHAS